MPDAASFHDLIRLQEEGEIWNMKECITCGEPDREDFVMRRVHERDFACKYCRAPGLGVWAFTEPVRSLHKIPRMIRAGYFNRYEAFA